MPYTSTLLKDVKIGTEFLYVEPIKGHSYLCTHRLDRRCKPVQCLLTPLYPDKHLPEEHNLVEWESAKVTVSFASLRD